MEQQADCLAACGERPAQQMRLGVTLGHTCATLTWLAGQLMYKVCTSLQLAIGNRANGLVVEVQALQGKCLDSFLSSASRSAPKDLFSPTAP
eukprot:356004-Chlamydomonas_euryale.AAC.6